MTTISVAVHECRRQSDPRRALGLNPIDWEERTFAASLSITKPPSLPRQDPSRPAPPDSTILGTFFDPRLASNASRTVSPTISPKAASPLPSTQTNQFFFRRGEQALPHPHRLPTSGRTSIRVDPDDHVPRSGYNRESYGRMGGPVLRNWDSSSDGRGDRDA